MIDSKTTQHILCECPVSARVILKHFGKDILSPPLVKSQDPKIIIGYLEATEIIIIYRPWVVLTKDLSRLK
jgi:hypothetical protein